MRTAYSESFLTDIVSYFFVRNSIGRLLKNVRETGMVVTTCVCLQIHRMRRRAGGAALQPLLFLATGRWNSHRPESL